MYEWVLLLVNLVLWPVSIISTMVVGANTEFMGMGPFNFDENWLLLVGAWAPTSFSSTCFTVWMPQPVMVKLTTWKR